MASDSDSQHRALRFLCAELLVNQYPPLRVIVSADDFERLRAGIAASPFQFVLQIVLMGIVWLFKDARSQPRGRTEETASRGRILSFLACLAYDLLKREGILRRVEAEARSAGHTPVGGSLALSMLTHFLVSRAMRRHCHFDLESSRSLADFRTFAQAYLYRHRVRLTPEIQKALKVPGLCRRLFGIDFPEDEIST
jgi:hypothetical protein